MADVKISALPASTTPLDGTEVLPIVQGSTTKQVSIANVTAGRAVSALSVTTDTNKAASSAGGALQANNGTVCLQWGAGGGSGLIFDGGVSSTAANAAIVFSPTGTGTVAISPTGALTVNPTAASTINNTSIGVTTPAAGGFTTVKAATTIGVGNATPSASGAGITFPATQSASSDANTLDDYEEGTWTPIVGGTATYTAQVGKYTKVGNVVTLYAQLIINVLGTGSTTGISGLPFNFATGQDYISGSVGYHSSLATNVLYLRPYYDPGSAVNVFFANTNVSGTGSGIQTPIFGNSARVAFTITYFSA